ncbi:MAG TPA: hypothetical protein ENF73_01405 [Proteobacteria bacterium]|nr:hypothetical protein [Pseudomonadota bacterium]
MGRRLEATSFFGGGVERKAIVLGFDGLDPKLVLAWEARLPNFRRLISSAAWGPLRSTIHPLTPQAWTSLVCGTNPGKHGIFDFGRRARNSYRIELVNSSHRKTWSIWELASDAGVKVGIFNVPLSWPPDEVNGFMICGMHSPSIESISYPAELSRELMKNIPHYRIDAMIHWYDDESEFLDDCMDMIEQRWKAADWLWNKFKPQLFMPVFVATDRIMHALWHTLPDRIEDTPDDNPVFAIHRKLDEVLGWALELCTDDDLLVVCSDHGFGPLKKDVYLNRFLADAGYLRFDPEKVRKFKRRIDPDSRRDPRHGWHLKRYGEPPPLPSDDELIELGKVDPWYLDFEVVDWKRTFAYSFGMMGNIFINTEGREPEGIVRWGREYEETRDRIIRDLKSLVDPDDGEPLASAIYRREELYWGPGFWDAPDVVVVLRDYAYTTRGATEFWGERRLTAEPVVPHSGNHRLNGFFAARGSDIPARRIEGIELTDVAPFVMAHLGIPLPQYIDGKRLISMYNDSFAWEKRRLERGAEAGYRENEENAVGKRLRDLGYLG